MIYIILATIIALCAGLVVLDMLKWRNGSVAAISVIAICICEVAMLVSVLAAVL